MVLDDLYCGNIYPAEQVVPHEKEYRKLHRHTGELLTELEEKLSKEQMELVNQFHTHVIDVHCMELEAHFQHGFSLCWSREIATIFCREYLTNFCQRTPELVE